MTTVGRWSPNKVRARVLDGTWVSTEELGGMVLLTPTSIAYSGTSASIGANGSVEFSACSSLSLNGVFSADYDNYMVAVSGTTSNNAGQIRFRMRTSGTDATGSDYTRQRLSADGTTVSGPRDVSQIAGVLGYLDDGLSSGTTGVIYGPYLAQPTASRGITASAYNDAYIGDYATTHSLSVSYDGITFSPDFGTQTITGLISVYGLVGA